MYDKKSEHFCFCVIFIDCLCSIKNCIFSQGLVLKMNKNQKHYKKAQKNQNMSFAVGFEVEKTHKENHSRST